MSVWDDTRDLHHACEEHVVGAALAAGNPSMQWYVDWLKALQSIHEVIDSELHSELHKVSRLFEDIAASKVYPNTYVAVEDFCKALQKNKALRQGTSYVLSGAHLMGGEIMRRHLEGFSTKHLEWDSRPTALTELKVLREQPGVTTASRQCFAALLAVMDAIAAKEPV